MRNKLMMWTAVLLCSATLASAQQQPAAPAPGAVTGTVDFGFRGGTEDGDFARYERYRDLRDGAFSRIDFGQQKENSSWNAGARNIGYRDQTYFANFTNAKSRFTGSFDAIPLNYSYLTSTPWVQTQTGVFTLPDAAQTAVQNRQPGVVGIPTTAAMLNTASIYRGLATQFDLRSRRDTLAAAYAYDVNKQLAFNVAFSTMKRSGSQPYGMSFAFNNANELPLPLNNRTNEFAAGLEYSREKGMLRLGWESSFFNQNINTVTWENPIRLTDVTPYDSNGYSNGNGPAFGTLPMMPSNSLNSVSLTGLYKLPARTTVNGMVSFTAMNQNDALIPFASNPAVLNSPIAQAAYPGLNSLSRNTAEAKIHGVNAMFNLASRPNRYVGLRARYRYNDRNNLTPEFDGRSYVAFDAAPRAGIFSRYYNITQNTLDVTGSFNVIRYATLNVGYVYNGWERTHRQFSNVNDHTLRTSIDVLGNEWVTVRANYDYTQRKNSGYSPELNDEIGHQPGVRFYDEAERTRNRGTLMATFNPIDIIDITAMYSMGRDNYANGQGFEFGLLDNDNENVSVVLGITPSDRVNVGASYGRDHYKANQVSRNANPAPDAQWTDPARNWSLNNEEIVNNVDVFLNLPELFAKTNVRFNYDYSDSDNGFTFGGPRISSLAAAGTFLPLPNVTNTWNRLTADVQYRFAQRVGLGLGYWYEKFDVSDFATIDLPGQPGQPRIDYLGALTTGYGNRPYKGSTAFLRVLYFF